MNTNKMTYYSEEQRKAVFDTLLDNSIWDLETREMAEDEIDNDIYMSDLVLRQAAQLLADSTCKLNDLPKLISDVVDELRKSVARCGTCGVYRHVGRMVRLDPYIRCENCN